MIFCKIGNDPHHYYLEKYWSIITGMGWFAATLELLYWQARVSVEWLPSEE
jgi:hypothetical protein